MSSTTDRAIARMREMVVTGELSPGDRLPAEPELARMVGVSRNSLREAVAALELVRVLDVRRGDGTYVTSLAPERTISEHRAIFAALRAGDAALAQSWATIHIAGVESWLRQAAEAPGGPRDAQSPET